MLVTFNWLKEFVEINVAPKELAKRLTMSGLEVESIQNVKCQISNVKCEEDTVFDINITPNRGDCLSVLGLAREISAVLGTKLKFPSLKKGGKRGFKSTFSIKDLLSVIVKDKKACKRYCAMAIDGVKIAPSPAYITSRLEACGIRPINNVVDATNYMMLLTGQPFHAFDHRFIRGKAISIETAKDGMEFITLDGIARKLTKDDLLICDGEGPVALAGVMGGANSEVRPDTTTIVLESAAFLHSSVRKTSKSLALASESSRRFERMVDPAATLDNLKMLADLIVEISGGTATSDFIDIYSVPVKPIKVKFSAKEAEELVGVKLAESACKRFFSSLGISYVKGVCTIPTFRPDLERGVDLIEEVVRLNGYDKIPFTLPEIKMSTILRPESFDLRLLARETLTKIGFYEAVNYGFCSPSEFEVFSKEKPVVVSNPLGVEFSIMKPTLLTGLLGNLKRNLSMGQDVIKLFELRPVFKYDGSKISERLSLTGITCGLKRELSWASSNGEVDFYDIKGLSVSLLKTLNIDDFTIATEGIPEYIHPRAGLVFRSAGKIIGHCGEIHPEVLAKWNIEKPAFAFEFDWQALSGAAKGLSKQFKPLDRFPTVRRDIALLVADDICSEKILSEIKELNVSIVKDSFPFDVYKGKGIPEGKKSVAYAVLYFNPERTLTDEEVNNAHSKIIGHLKDKLGAEIR